MSAHVQLWRVLTLLKFVCLVLSSFLCLIFPLKTFISSQSNTNIFSHRRRSCWLIRFFLKCCYPCSSPPPKIIIRLLSFFFFVATVTQGEEINSGCKVQRRVSGDFTGLRNRTLRKSEHTCMLWTACRLLCCLFLYNNKKCCIHFTAHCKFMKASYVENLKFFHFKNTDIAMWIIFIVLYLPGGGWLGLRNVLIFQPRACL